MVFSSILALCFVAILMSNGGQVEAKSRFLKKLEKRSDAGELASELEEVSFN